MDLSDQVAGIESRSDLAIFVNRLAAAAASPESDEWENKTLARFLEAMAAWLEDMDGAFSNQGLEVPTYPTWQLIGDVLLAATIYE